jgi:hypothetical protein
MGCPHLQSGYYEEKKNVLPLLGIKRQFIRHLACRLVAVPTEVSQVNGNFVILLVKVFHVVPALRFLVSRYRICVTFAEMVAKLLQLPHGQ